MHGSDILVRPSNTEKGFHTDFRRYGGTLLVRHHPHLPFHPSLPAQASREYGVVDFFIIYMAVVQGAIAAGMWFSAAPSK